MSNQTDSESELRAELSLFIHELANSHVGDSLIYFIHRREREAEERLEEKGWMYVPPSMRPSIAKYIRSAKTSKVRYADTREQDLTQPPTIKQNKGDTK